MTGSPPFQENFRRRALAFAPDWRKPYSPPMQSQQLPDLLRAAEVQQGQGAQPAAELFAALYDELHRVAERQLHRNGGSVPLSTTTLVHEAYLDICGRSGTQFPDSARFIGYAARAMRGIVIDYMRYSRAAKRGGGAF